ncbi:MAG: hypothetical protein K2W82_18500 [Candidatus Obscuribacterales bacterium]|nr:hypothetical protein [Candidatus Obscuribacterales bacterium]
MINSTYFSEQNLTPKAAGLIAPRILAHLGDAVFALFERERETLQAQSVQQMHERVASRASAVYQSELLEKIMPALTEAEQEIVRRARNVKALGKRSAGQAQYRRSTAFEALLGYLYLSDAGRLREILNLTIDE